MWPSDGPSSPPSTNSFSSQETIFFPSLPSATPPPLRHHCVATLKGSHTSYTSALTLAGSHLFTGSSSGQIHHAPLSSLPHHQTLPSHAMIPAGEGAVKALVASSDKLITAHQDHKIRVWRVDQQKITQLATLPTLSDRAITLLLPSNHVRIRRHKTSTWVHHVDTVSALALSRDETLLYSVSWDRTLKIWRTADFKCLESVADAHDDAINAVAVSGSGAVYTGSSDGKIKAWRRKQGEKGYSLDAILVKHKAGINALAMGGDGGVLYSGASDRLICVWRSDGSGGMAAVAALRGHGKAVLCLAVVGEMVCSGSADQTVRVWRGIGKSYACLGVLEGHRGPIKCITVAFDDHCSTSNQSSTNCLLYSASLDCDIKVWRLCLSI